MTRRTAGASPLTTQESGVSAQAFAEAELVRAGYRTVARNLGGRGGELDLVMQKQAVFDGVIVVEVRARRPSKGFALLEALPKSKQEQVVRAATRLLPKQKWYWAAKGKSSKRTGVRFDAAFVELDATGRPVRMEHIPNAFTGTRPGGL